MYAELAEHLSRHQQLHLLDHWDHLDRVQQQRLAQQIQHIDFELMRQLADGHKDSTNWDDLAARAEPPPAIRLQGKNRVTKEAALAAGSEAIAAGRLGVVLVAGGQGSRLGFEHPKGMYPLGPISGRTLFQMHFEQLGAIARRFGVSIPLYLMTSPTSHDEILEFLADHDRFGLAATDLHVFCQGTMPAVDAKTGQVLLSAPDEIFVSPDGHGGTLAALEASGCLSDMQQRGITQIYYFQVDNPLVSICQADLIGYHVLTEAELTTQVIAKADAADKVGNVVSVDGNMMVIEYSDLPEVHAQRRDQLGQLLFWAGSIAVHVFDTDFLRRAAASSTSLPFHQALKKVPYIDGAGKRCVPEEPNAIKFERFIFDLLPSARNPLVVEAEEQEVFAPLKNATGAAKDTPEIVKAAIVAKHRRMLEAAGAKVNSNVQVEINPLFALDADELRQKIPADLQIIDDRYFDR